MNEHALKELWKEQPMTVSFSLNEIKHRAQKFERQINARNLREWGASIVVMLFFVWSAWQTSTTLKAIGALWIAAAALFVSVYVWRKGRHENLIDTAESTTAFMHAHMRSLRQQARLLRGAPLWYCLPFVPGLCLYFAGSLPSANTHVGVWIGVVTFVFAVLGVVGWVNLQASRKLDAEADLLSEE